MSQIKLRKYWRGKTMKIGVFDYCSATIDIIDVDDEIVDAYDSVEEYLISHFGYNNSNISWMADVKAVNYCDNDCFSNDETDQSDLLDIAYCNNHVQVVDGNPKAVGYFECADILVTNENIFGDNEEHSINMNFYDGFAIEAKDKNQLVLLYPTLNKVLSDPDLKKEADDYCGRYIDTPYEVALKFGKLYRLNEIMD